VARGKILFTAKARDFPIYHAQAGLISGTLIIENQLKFIRSKDLGFNFNNTLIINAPTNLAE